MSNNQILPIIPPASVATSFKSVAATALRAYRYGGVAELLGCIVDGCKSAAVPAFAQLARRPIPKRFWPEFSPELLLMASYRRGVWMSLDRATNRWAPIRELRHLCDVALRDADSLWRMGSNTQFGPPRADAHGKPALDEHLTDVNVLRAYFNALYGVTVTVSRIEGALESNYLIAPRLHCAPMVSVVIPTRDNVQLLDQAVRAVVEHGGCENFELLVVDNGSTRVETQHYLESLRLTLRLTVIRDDGPFNWSRLNNAAVTRASGDVLVFLNNDVAAISEGWLHRLAAFAATPGIGCVGPMLLYADGSIQHAGVVIGMGRWADHINKFKQPDLDIDSTPFVPPSITRPILAVTGACLAISRRNFDELGGFDEGFEIVFSDVELCVRAHRQALRNLYLGDVRLYHYESKSRNPKVVPDADFHRARDKLAPYRTSRCDPYFHPDLDKLSLAPKSALLPTNLSKWLRV
jgi:GT2 family glycosyltransferase